MSKFTDLLYEFLVAREAFTREVRKGDNSPYYNSATGLGGSKLDKNLTKAEEELDEFLDNRILELAEAYVRAHNI